MIVCVTKVQENVTNVLQVFSRTLATLNVQYKDVHHVIVNWELATLVLDYSKGATVICAKMDILEVTVTNNVHKIVPNAQIQNLVLSVNRDGLEEHAAVKKNV